MDNQKCYRSLTIIGVIAMCLIVFFIHLFSDNDKMKEDITKQAMNTITDIIVSEETQDIATETKKEVEKGKEVSTTETIKSSIKEEQKLEEEQLEPDAMVEQENISYNGDITGKGTKLLGKCTGLTYYSQADSRWAKTLYTSTNNLTQTMKSSACGPTSAAMIVSSSKGAILPTAMAKLSVDNGYRTANNGTAWSFYSFVADYFNFKEYYTTTNFTKAMSYLKTDKNKDGNSDYYIIVSCGSGLFTSNGHYICLMANKNGSILVYDPYLYTNKFNTASRKVANVKVDGNSVYVTEQNFKKYANYKNFWIFSNDYTVKKSSNSQVKKPTTTKKTTKKTTKSKVKNTVGKTKKLKVKCYLYGNSNLKGTKYTYKKNTTVIIQKNVSTKVDKVKVKATGRVAYIKNDLYR